MKGTIGSITEKHWTNPQGKEVTFWEFQLEGGQITYSMWSPNFASYKVGQEVEFDLSADKRGDMTKAKLSSVGQFGGQFQQKLSGKGDNKSFSASYSKDITVACIEKGMITKGTEIDATLRHYNSLFLELMGGKDA